VDDGGGAFVDPFCERVLLQVAHLRGRTANAVPNVKINMRTAR
jgi:hypothetical protein